MPTQAASSLRQDGLFLKSNDLREVVVPAELLADAKAKGVILVDLSMMAETMTLRGIDVGYNKTHFISAGIQISQGLETIQKQSGQVINFGWVIRVFLKGKAFLYRHPDVPPEIRELKLTPGDVLIVSKSREF